MIDAISQGQAAGRFSTEHLLHLRCELGYEHLYETVEPLAQHPLLVLLLDYQYSWVRQILF